MKKNITFQLEEKDIEKLKKLADAENRSIASFLRNIILKIIEQHEKEK